MRILNLPGCARGISLLGLLLAAGGGVWYQCSVNPNINFLTPGPASWIVYPMPRQAPAFTGMPMTSVFRRAFSQPQNPATATLSWRCFKQGELILNGVRVAGTGGSSWKQTSHLNVANYIRPGTNEIEVQVACDNGLPALSLELAMDGLLLKSDEDWQSSLAGAVWLPARKASRPFVDPAPGNFLYGGEDIQGAVRQCWPMLIVFLIVAALAFAAREHWRGLLLRKVEFTSLFLLGGAWMALLLHNLPLLPGMSGFDAPAHLAYIEFIQKHHAFPSADQGWECFQAPLYYLFGAIALGLFNLHPMQPEAGQVLGIMNMLLGAGELVVIFAVLRGLFPDRRGLPLAGLLLAAFLPAQIYLLHYPTNEIMAAVTTTLAIGLCLRVLRRENPGLECHALLGLALGLALLSKASALVTITAVFLALAAKAWFARQSPAAFLRRTVLCFGLCFIVGGWHYVRLWRQFGNPFIGNWDPALVKAWWQQPGYRTLSYYFSFGQSLTQPLFSGLHSFWDGLYSTWWGDGLIGGATRLYGRTPWNYNPMTVGCALALLPSALILTGLWRMLRDGISQRRLDWLFLAAVTLLYGLAIFLMSLKVPSYSQSRSFYGLSVVLPICVMGALGLDFWAAKFPRTRAVLFVWLGAWLLTVYATFWIQPNSVQTRLAIAIGCYPVPGQDPGPSFEKVLELDPHNAIALTGLAELDKNSGHIARAAARLETAAQTTSNEKIDTTLAQCLAQEGRTEDALAWARRACDLASDYPAAPAALCALSLRAGQNEQAEQAGTLALRLAPQDDEVHFDVGLAAIRLKHFAEAVSHFSYAEEIRPESAEAHFWLGISLWNMPGKKAEGRNQVAIAVRLAPQNDKWKATLIEMQRDQDRR
jgi:Tfp pilus assembly protein PilF